MLLLPVANTLGVLVIPGGRKSTCKKTQTGEEGRRDFSKSFQGQGWLDEGELTDEEKRMLNSRLDECDRNPSSFVPWEQAKTRIQASLKK